jgi:hypothetical protein
LYFVRRADIRRARKIIAELSLEKIDMFVEPFWPKPPRELETFVLTLALRPDLEPARSWIARHESELREIPPRMVIVAPKSAAKAIRRGARISYPGALGLHWDVIKVALARLTQVDRELAAQYVRKEIGAIAQSLSTHQANLYEKSDDFLAYIESLSRGIVQAILSRIDPELARKHWPQLLHGNSAQKRAVDYLLAAVAGHGGPLKGIGAAMRKSKVPKSAREV